MALSEPRVALCEPHMDCNEPHVARREPDEIFFLQCSYCFDLGKLPENWLLG